MTVQTSSETDKINCSTIYMYFALPLLIIVRRNLHIIANFTNFTSFCTVRFLHVFLHFEFLMKFKNFLHVCNFELKYFSPQIHWNLEGTIDHSKENISHQKITDK